MTETLLTTAERKREALHDTVCNHYMKIKKNNGDASSYRLMKAVAEKTGLTPAGVRGILLRRGLYTPSATPTAASGE